MAKKQPIILPILYLFLLISINTCLCQQHFQFNFKSGLILHYRGSFDVNSRLDKPDPSIHDTIKDFVVSIDTTIAIGGIQYVKFHSSEFSYQNKSVSKSISEYIKISFCNEEGKELLFYKGQLFQLKTSNGFYDKYLGKDLLLKKLLDNAELQDSSDDLTIFPFIDPTNHKSCESYRTSSNRLTKMMEGEFYCFNRKENLPAPYGGTATVFEKLNWASLNSPDSYYYYSDAYFISKFERDFNIPGMNWVHYELSLYKIED